MKKKLYKISFLIFFTFLLASCSSSTDYEIQSNKSFKQKYGKEIQKIRTERTPPKNEDKVVVKVTPPTSQELYNESSKTEQEYYAYVDVSKFGERQPQNYLPNREVYETAANNAPGQGIPPDIFEISYNTNLYPAFRVIGAEFDYINVPPYDAYGVRTAMSDKTYLLAGGDALQRSIDTVSNERDRDDVEISEILIKEQKQLKKKQKMEKIFGDDAKVELVAFKSEGELEKSYNTLPPKQSKSIGQVVSGFVVKTIKN